MLSRIWYVADRRTFFAYFIALIQTLPQIVATQSLAPADHKMGSRLCRFRGADCRQISLQIDSSGATFGLARELYCRRVYLSQPGFAIKRGDVVVDLGANAGLFTLLAARTGATVLAVEAQCGYRSVIESHLIRNECVDRVEIAIGRVGAESGVFSAQERAREFAYWGEGSPPRQLCELLACHGVSKIDFLKVDIEGSEFALFATASSWLDQVEKIAMEVHPQFGMVSNLVATLQEAGFGVTLHNKELGAVDQVTDALGYLFATRKRNADR